MIVLGDRPGDRWSHRAAVGRLVRVAARVVVLAATTLGTAGAQATPANIRNFDAYVAKAMKDWKVPGMALAIVRNDSIVFAKGYGVRKLGESTPVDPRTVFAIGSSTKAFTSAAVAMMVDDGKMKWDAPLSTCRDPDEHERSLLPFVMAHRVFDDQLKQVPTDYRRDTTEGGFAGRDWARCGVQARGGACREHPSVARARALRRRLLRQHVGDVRVRAGNGKLTLRYAGMSDGVLEHWHYDTYRAVWGNRLLGKSMVTFVIDGSARVSEMRIENLADFRRASCTSTTPPC